MGSLTSRGPGAAGAFSSGRAPRGSPSQLDAICAGVWASVWLTVTPTEHGLSFLDGEYPALVRFRLHVPLDPGCGRCRRGGTSGPGAWRRWYDPDGDHVHSCIRNSGAWTRRHGHLRDQLVSLLRWLGFWAEAEQEDPNPPHRPDVRAHGFTLPVTHFEVHISHPAHWHVDATQARRGSSNLAFVEEAWRRRLARHYAGGPRGRVRGLPNLPAEAGKSTYGAFTTTTTTFHLVPAVASSYGGWHPAFA